MEDNIKMALREVGCVENLIESGTGHFVALCNDGVEP
jgi:hypothetical protein